MPNQCTYRSPSSERCVAPVEEGAGLCALHRVTSTAAAIGREFEENVTKTLRLLGYSVERDVTINGCQVDVLAEYRTGVVALRLLVECKNLGDRPVGVGDLKEFTGVVATARNRGAVDKGLVVTTRGYTREARELAVAAGVDIATFSELSTQLVNFDQYVDTLIVDFESQPVASYYIPLSSSEREDYAEADRSTLQSPLEDVVDRLWLQGRGRLALLGNFGTGKTTFCRKYARDLALRYKSDPTQPIPVLVNLSDFESQIDIQQLITNTLQFRHGVRIDLTLVHELQRLGRLVFIFDGFDEMAARVDHDVVRDNVRQLDKLARIPSNRVLVTCRTHFFRDRLQAELLAQFDLLYVPEWGEDELREYLAKRFGGEEWRTVLDRIHGTHNLTELAQTPLFLDMIVQTLPSLGDSVERVRLYEEYTGRWIRDQSQRRGARLNTEERQAIVEGLAIRMYRDDRIAVHFSELASLLRKTFSIEDAAEIDYVQADVRACTFLTRNSEGQYRFQHNSFMAFFAAKVIVAEIGAGEDAAVKSKLLPIEIMDFVVDLLRAKDSLAASMATLLQWLRTSEDDIRHRNAFAILTRLNVDVAELAPDRTDPAQAAERLTAAFVRGDERAFEVLVAQELPHIRSWARRISGSSAEADDIAIEALERAWFKRERFDPGLGVNIRGWLFGTARHIAFDRLRVKRRHESVDIEDFLRSYSIVDDSRDPEELVMESETSALLYKALARLGKEDEKLIVERYLEQRPLEDVAAALGVSKAAAAARGRRALLRLRTEVEVLLAPHAN